MSISLRDQILNRLQPFTEYLQLSCGHLIPEPEDCKMQTGDEAFFCLSCDKNKTRVFNRDLGNGKYPKEVINRLYKIVVDSKNDDQLIEEFRNFFSQLDVKFFPEEIKNAFAAISGIFRSPTPIRPVPVKAPSPLLPPNLSGHEVLVQPQKGDMHLFYVTKVKDGFSFEISVKLNSKLGQQLVSEGIPFTAIESNGFYKSTDGKNFQKIWKHIHGLIGFDDANRISQIVTPYLISEAPQPIPPLLAWDPVPFAPIQEKAVPAQTFWSMNLDDQTSEVLVLGGENSDLISFSIAENKRSKEVHVELITQSYHYVGMNAGDLKDIWKKVIDLKVLDQKEEDKISAFVDRIGQTEIDLTSRESLKGAHPSYGTFDVPANPPFLPTVEEEEMTPDEVEQLFAAMELSKKPKDEQKTD